MKESESANSSLAGQNRLLMEESRNHKSSFIFEMEPLNQGITEEEDDDRVEDKAADGLDWEELRIEWRDLFKDNPENRFSWTFVKTSLIIFATSLLPSLFDMGSDALSVYDFINGTTYTKYVSDLNQGAALILTKFEGIEDICNDIH